MPARRRRIVANRLYEIEIRTRTGLPFVSILLMRLLLASAMARAQRDYRVVICHFLWMANHLHLLIVTKDAQQCVNFYSELMKKTTDYIKRLLNLSSLQLWEPSGPVVSEVLDLPRAQQRVVYLYTNPAHAGLVESVSDYPGFSSWAFFRSHPRAIEELQNIPWIRQPTIQVLPSRTLTEKQDKFLEQKLRSRNTTCRHSLSIDPNALYKVFGVYEEKEIAQHNETIITNIKEREASYASTRQKSGKLVVGAKRLKGEPIFKAYTPERKPTDRKILFHTSLKELALSFLEDFNAFCQACRRAYLAWKDGNHLVQWPPGAFRPPICPVANCL